METWAPDTREAQQGPIWIWDLLCVAISGHPTVLSYSICSVPQPSSLGLPPPDPSTLQPPPPEGVLGGRGWGGAGPSSVREVGMGAGPRLPVVHRPGALGGISLATPTPQGRGRSPGESQAWGRSQRVRRGGRTFVTKVPGLGAPFGPGPKTGLWDTSKSNCHPAPSTQHPPPLALAVLTGAYLGGAGASWGHGERGGLILGVL